VGEGLGEASAGVEVGSAEVGSTCLDGSGEGVIYTAGDGELGPTGADEGCV
jgi:hypothetical protein